MSPLCHDQTRNKLRCKKPFWGTESLYWEMAPQTAILPYFFIWLTAILANSPPTYKNQSTCSISAKTCQPCIVAWRGSVKGWRGEFHCCKDLVAAETLPLCQLLWTLVVTLRISYKTRKLVLIPNLLHKAWFGNIGQDLPLGPSSQGSCMRVPLLFPTPVCTFTSSHHGDVKFLLNDSLLPNRDVLCSEVSNREKLWENLLLGRALHKSWKWEGREWTWP